MGKGLGHAAVLEPLLGRGVDGRDDIYKRTGKYSQRPRTGSDASAA